MGCRPSQQTGAVMGAAPVAGAARRDLSWELGLASKITATSWPPSRQASTVRTRELRQSVGPRNPWWDWA